MIAPTLDERERDHGPTALRWPRLVLLAIVAIVAAAGVATAISRTLIPHAVVGEVDEVIHHNANAGGTDYWSLDMLDGRHYVIERETAGAIPPNTMLQKHGPGRSAIVAGSTVRLPIPDATVRYLLAMTMLLVIITVLACKRRDPGSAPNPVGESPVVAS